VRDEATKLQPIADRLRAVDRANASALDCRIAIGKRDYRRAIAIANVALERDPIVELHICLAHAYVLAGHVAASGAAAKRAFDLWPIDLREWGGFALHAEHLLYQGKLDEYLALVRTKPSRQRTLALALWKPTTPDLATAEPAPNDRSARTPPPLGAVLWILIRSLAGHDETATYNAYPEPEVRLYGQALAAEQRGDHATAIARYREALDVPARGDIHMLVSHHLARVLDAQGDATGAAAACRGVLAPALYHAYRAVLWPDCVRWTHDPALDRQLVDAWRDSTFAHPAVIEVRQRLSR
jgi:tetratricopeptide (TPR) repeat protein